MKGGGWIDGAIGDPRHPAIPLHLKHLRHFPAFVQNLASGGLSRALEVELCVLVLVWRIALERPQTVSKLARLLTALATNGD